MNSTRASKGPFGLVDNTHNYNKWISRTKKNWIYHSDRNVFTKKMDSTEYPSNMKSQDFNSYSSEVGMDFYAGKEFQPIIIVHKGQRYLLPYADTPDDPLGLAYSVTGLANGTKYYSSNAWCNLGYTVAGRKRIKNRIRARKKARLFNSNTETSNINNADYNDNVGDLPYYDDYDHDE